MAEAEQRPHNNLALLRTRAALTIYEPTLIVQWQTRQKTATQVASAVVGVVRRMVVSWQAIYAHKNSAHVRFRVITSTVRGAIVGMMRSLRTTT